jgi:hypothetical protein
MSKQQAPGGRMFAGLSLGFIAEQVENKHLKGL